MKMPYSTKKFAKKLLSYIYHLLGKKQVVIAIESNAKMVLDYDFISQLLEGTVNGKYNWQSVYRRYVHDSSEFTVCFKVEEEVLSGDARILIIASAPNKDATLSYFYQEDKEWVVANQLKYAIVKSIGGQ